MGLAWFPPQEQEQQQQLGMLLEEGIAEVDSLEEDTLVGADILVGGTVEEDNLEEDTLAGADILVEEDVAVDGKDFRRQGERQKDWQKQQEHVDRQRGLRK